jgi:hypothetical protein
MEDEYDRQQSAALIKEARELTAELKVEVGKIHTQMGRVLDGRLEDADEDQPPVASGASQSGKPFWRFWR